MPPKGVTKSYLVTKNTSVQEQYLYHWNYKELLKNYLFTRSKITGVQELYLYPWVNNELLKKLLIYKMFNNWCSGAVPVSLGCWGGLWNVIRIA
jgi:hypothetical protein